MSNRYTILRTIRGSRKGNLLAELLAPVARGAGRPIAESLAALGDDPPELRVDTAPLSPGELRSVMRDPEVAGVAQTMPIKLLSPVDEPESGDDTAWGLTPTGALKSSYDGGGVVVAVLDTGIDRDHPAFTGVELVERDFSGSGAGDKLGHGTHCAGTIFGRDVGGKRIGLARGVKRPLIGKVVNDKGLGTTSSLVEAIVWAIQRGANVISMSLSLDFNGYLEQLKLEGYPAEAAASLALEAYRSNVRTFDSLMTIAQAYGGWQRGGAIIVAAAGNESRRDRNPKHEIGLSLPAAALDVVSVGAAQPDKNGLILANFSNTPPELAAPGVGILSAKAGGGLHWLSGTSVAAPHVAGIAAQWWQAVREATGRATAAQVIAKLLANARADVFAPGVDPADRGAGLVMAPAV